MLRYGFRSIHPQLGLIRQTILHIAIIEMIINNFAVDTVDTIDTIDAIHFASDATILVFLIGFAGISIVVQVHAILELLAGSRFLGSHVRLAIKIDEQS